MSWKISFGHFFPKVRSEQPATTKTGAPPKSEETLAFSKGITAEAEQGAAATKRHMFRLGLKLPRHLKPRKKTEQVLAHETFKTVQYNPSITADASGMRNFIVDLCESLIGTHLSEKDGIFALACLLTPTPFGVPLYQLTADQLRDLDVKATIKLLRDVSSRISTSLKQNQSEVDFVQANTIEPSVGILQWKGLGLVSEAKLSAARKTLIPIEKNPFVPDERLQHTARDMLGMVAHRDPDLTKPLSRLVSSLSIAAGLKNEGGWSFLRSLDTPQKREEARQELNKAIANHPAKDSPQCKQLKALAILLTETRGEPLYALDNRDAPFYKKENEQNASDVFRQVAAAFDHARDLYGSPHRHGLPMSEAVLRTEAAQLRQEIEVLELHEEVAQRRRQIAALDLIEAKARRERTINGSERTRIGLEAIKELRESNQRLA